MNVSEDSISSLNSFQKCTMNSFGIFFRDTFRKILTSLILNFLHKIFQICFHKYLKKFLLRLLQVLFSVILEEIPSWILAKDHREITSNFFSVLPSYICSKITLVFPPRDSSDVFFRSSNFEYPKKKFQTEYLETGWFNS